MASRSNRSLSWHRTALARASLVAAFALSSPAAFAQTSASSEQAATLIREGRTLLQQGQAQDALDRFTRAFQLAQSPTARAHMGVAEGALGHPVEAERYLREALDAPTDSLMQPAWVERFRENLRVAQRSVGLFTVRANVAGAHVLLNGRDVGTVPFAAPIRVRAETVRMRVVADGFYALERDVIISGELAVTTESVELNRVVRDPASTPGNTAASAGVQNSSEPTNERATVVRPVVAPVVTQAPPTVVIVSRDGTESRGQQPGGSSVLVGLSVASGVLGVLGIGAGVAGVLVANHNNGEYAAAGCASRTNVIECDQAQSNAAIAGTVSIAGFVSGGLFTVASIALGIAAARSAPPRASGAQAWTCAPSLSGIRCGARF
ncbi:MAG: tetratricopeptide repeat protein [Polyangiales bacterium]